MLSRITHEKMRTEGLALRQAAHQAGISHTTMARICNGKPVDISTIMKVAEWLGIEYRSLLPDGNNDLQRTANAIYVLLHAHPDLANAFTTCIDRLEAGKISSNDVIEIISFITYKLQLEHG